MSIKGVGPMSAKILVLTDYPRVSAKASGVPFSDWERKFFEAQSLAAGLHPSEIRFECILSQTQKFPPRNISEEIKKKTYKKINDLPELRVIVPLGELSLRVVTGKEQLEKWQLSLIPTCPELSSLGKGVRKAVPSFHPSEILKENQRFVFLQLALAKAKLESKRKELNYGEKKFLLNPPKDEAIAYLEEVVSQTEILSNDIETGRGQINTVGFAVSPSEAIAINVLPKGKKDTSFHHMWSLIAKILENPEHKTIYQNFTYECTFYSRYGIRIGLPFHDTMWAQKFLWPEFKKGLDSVGRFYTRQPYWKDDGASWNNIRDWPRHYEYNCSDTAGTYEGYLGQHEDLGVRGLIPLFYERVMKLAGPIREMSLRGLLIDPERMAKLNLEIDKEIKSQTELITKESEGLVLNPNSTKQLKEYFKGKKLKLYKKYNSADKVYRESLDEERLLKMRVKYPKDALLPLVIRTNELRKKKDSNGKLELEDGRLRFSLNPVGDEFLGTTGFPSGLDLSLIRPEEGKTFFHITHKNSVARFIALDSCDFDLLAEVGTNPEINSVLEKELSKKSECLFGSLERWKLRLQEELRKTRMLKTPFGFERQFFARMDDALFTEAYYFRAKATISELENKLLLHLYEKASDFNFLFKDGNSLVLEGKPGDEAELRKLITEANQKIILPGGDFTIDFKLHAGANL